MKSKILVERSRGKWLEKPGKILEYKIRMGHGLNWLRIMSHAIQKNNKFCLLLCLFTKYGLLHKENKVYYMYLKMKFQQKYLNLTKYKESCK